MTAGRCRSPSPRAARAGDVDSFPSLDGGDPVALAEGALGRRGWVGDSESPTGSR
jgi:hypothetical protein